MTIQQQWNEHQHIPSTSEECLDRVIETVVERAIFGGHEMARRRFLQLVGASYADGLGNIKEVPDRINFDPFPWHSMAVWILTQMKRWKHVDSDLDYKQVAEQVYLAAECDKISRELGYPSHAQTYTTHTILGKVFDPKNAAEYARSFAISNL